MTTATVIQSQYHSALAMLKQAIEKCPPDLWVDPHYDNAYWHIAYHALFYTHLYAQPSMREFKPWPKHRAEYESLGPPQHMPKIGEPYSHADLLEFLEYCHAYLDSWLEGLDFAAESGFDWLPFSKLELQFYTIRHLQQHTGELCERLWARQRIAVDWIG